MWRFIQEQILGMKWLNEGVGKLLSLIGIDMTTRLGGAFQFFFYDVIKITILLCVVLIDTLFLLLLLHLARQVDLAYYDIDVWD